MAASSLRAVRTALTGTHLVSGRWLLAQSSQTQAVRPSLRLHVCSRMESERSSDGGRAQEEAEEPEGTEYIPRKAKNPMMKIGYAWIIGLPAGIISFFLAKIQVDKNRLNQLKIRQRMRKSNEGEYEGSRYRHRAQDVELHR